MSTINSSLTTTPSNLAPSIIDSTRYVSVNPQVPPQKPPKPPKPSPPPPTKSKPPPKPPKPKPPPPPKPSKKKRIEKSGFSETLKIRRPKPKSNPSNICAPIFYSGGLNTNNIGYYIPSQIPKLTRKKIYQQSLKQPNIKQTRKNK